MPHVYRILRVKVVVTKKVPTDKLVDLRPCGCVRIWVLAHSLKFVNVKAIWHDTVRLALQKILRLQGRDVRYSSKDVRTVCGCTLDAVSMVYAALSGFVVNVEVLDIVIKVNIARGEVTAKESSVCCEHCRDIDATFPADGDGDTCLPFVEVSDDSSIELPGDILPSGHQSGGQNRWSEKRTIAHLAQEPGYKVTEQDGVIGLNVMRRGRDACEVPQVPFPLV